MKIERIGTVKRSKKHISSRDNGMPTAKKKSVAQSKSVVKNETTLRKKRKKRLGVVEKAALHFGKTHMFVGGSNCMRAVSAISKLYKVQNVMPTRDGVEFTVSSKQCDKIIALLNNLCYDYKIIGLVGPIPHFLLAVGRVGLVAGLIFCLAVGCVFPQYATRVSVQCVGATLDSRLSYRINDVLNECGVARGNKISAMDIDNAQIKLLALDEIAYASVQRNGTHITVVVKQALDNVVVDIVGSGVIAKKRAVITRIIVESGTAVKKYGDVVDKGEVLIDGYVIYGDDKIPVEAKGFAYGKVYYEKSMFFANDMLEKHYGQTKTVVKLSMFGKEPKAPQAPFERCEQKVEISNYGFLLPIKIYTYTFREVVIERCENNMSIDDMKIVVYSSIVQTFEQDTVVLDKIFEVEHKNNGVLVRVTVEAEERI